MYCSASSGSIYVWQLYLINITPFSGVSMLSLLLYPVLYFLALNPLHAFYLGCTFLTCSLLCTQCYPSRTHPIFTLFHGFNCVPASYTVSPGCNIVPKHYLPSTASYPQSLLAPPPPALPLARHSMNLF